MNTGINSALKPALKPTWAGSDLRLDPFRLPQAVSYAGRDDQGDVTFTIDHRGVTIRRLLEASRLPVSIALPARAFRGVAARAIEDGDGEVTVTLELLHADPMLSVPLLVAHDLDDVAADWRAWSDAYQLPMLLIEADGVARTLEESLGLVKKRPPVERRKGRVSTQRRPRFLARRQTGDLGVRLVVDGNEIIARDAD
ncbi:MAG TPA: DUF6101 family protein [Aquamicrobium sp.]|jgi:hypothetical protein|nr:DUF6101 family protein [Aquamicrobium sp.]